MKKSELREALAVAQAEARVYKEALYLATSEDAADKIVKLVSELTNFRKQSTDCCGTCGEPIESDIVNIRSLGAPNPFCSMDCAKQWSDTGTGSGFT